MAPDTPDTAKSLSAIGNGLLIVGALLVGAALLFGGAMFLKAWRITGNLQSGEIFDAVASVAGAASASIVTIGLVVTWWQNRREADRRNAEQLSRRGIELVEKAFADLRDSVGGRVGYAGEHLQTIMAPPRDELLWKMVAKRLDEALVLRELINDVLYLQIYDHELSYSRLKFNPLLHHQRNGFPRWYFGDPDLEAKYGYAIPEEALVTIYRFAQVSGASGEARGKRFSENERYSFMIGNQHGLYRYLRDVSLSRGEEIE